MAFTNLFGYPGGSEVLDIGNTDYNDLLGTSARQSHIASTYPFGPTGYSEVLAMSSASDGGPYPSFSGPVPDQAERIQSNTETVESLDFFRVFQGPGTVSQAEQKTKKSALLPHRAQHLRVRRDHINFENRIALAILAVQQKGLAIYLQMQTSQAIFLYHHVLCANYGARIVQLLGVLSNKLPIIQRNLHLMHSSGATLLTMAPMSSNTSKMASRLPVQQLCQAMTVP